MPTGCPGALKLTVYPNRYAQNCALELSQESSQFNNEY